MVGVAGHAIWGDLEQAQKFAVEPVQVPQVHHRWATEQTEPGLRRLSCLEEEEEELYNNDEAEVERESGEGRKEMREQYHSAVGDGSAR
ncbi:MAG: hypothetical protein Q9195_008423 [Heterodermia aff. obscurata]